MGRALARFARRYKYPKDWVPATAPLHMRKQIFLPDFVIALIRTPFLPPRFASFYVPLHFNKLDMKDYMKRVYNVDVIRVRSYIEQQKVTRERRDGRPGYGPLRRPQSKKRMTIEMTEPFVWPDPPKDMSPWEKDQFHKAAKFQREMSEKMQPQATLKPDEEDREAYAKQAKELLEGKAVWRPTWQALGLNYNRPNVASLTKPKS